MRGTTFALVALVLSATAGAAVAQGRSVADPRARCAQLVAYWQLHGGAKSEGGGGADMARKRAEVDCEAGRFDSGIRAMEDLLRRNGYAVPPVEPSRSSQ